MKQLLQHAVDLKLFRSGLRGIVGNGVRKKRGFAENERKSVSSSCCHHLLVASTM